MASNTAGVGGNSTQEGKTEDSDLLCNWDRLWEH